MANPIYGKYGDDEGIGAVALRVIALPDAGFTGADEGAKLASVLALAIDATTGKWLAGQELPYCRIENGTLEGDLVPSNVQEVTDVNGSLITVYNMPKGGSLKFTAIEGTSGFKADMFNTTVKVGKAAAAGKAGWEYVSMNTIRPKRVVVLISKESSTPGVDFDHIVIPMGGLIPAFGFKGGPEVDRLPMEIKPMVHKAFMDGFGRGTAVFAVKGIKPV